MYGKIYDVYKTIGRRNVSLTLRYIAKSPLLEGFRQEFPDYPHSRQMIWKIVKQKTKIEY